MHKCILARNEVPPTYSLDLRYSSLLESGVLVACRTQYLTTESGRITHEMALKARLDQHLQSLAVVPDRGFRIHKVRHPPQSSLPIHQLTVAPSEHTAVIHHLIPQTHSLVEQLSNHQNTCHHAFLHCCSARPRWPRCRSEPVSHS